jgi:hypothetical protein
MLFGPKYPLLRSVERQDSSTHFSVPQFQHKTPLPAGAVSLHGGRHPKLKPKPKLSSQLCQKRRGIIWNSDEYWNKTLPTVPARKIQKARNS